MFLDDSNSFHQVSVPFPFTSLEHFIENGGLVYPSFIIEMLKVCYEHRNHDFVIFIYFINKLILYTVFRDFEQGRHWVFSDICFQNDFIA